MRGAEPAILSAVEVLFPQALRVALAAQPRRAFLPQVVEPELPCGEHGAGAAPHHLAPRVAGVGRDQLHEDSAVLGRWRDALEHEPNPDLTHPEAPSGIVFRVVGRLGERALEVRDVVALELNQSALAESTERVDDARAAEVDGAHSVLRVLGVCVLLMRRPPVVVGTLCVARNRANRLANMFDVPRLVGWRFVPCRRVQHSADPCAYAGGVPKVEHLVYGDRKVFTVSAFNRGIGMHLGRLPAVWVEGEVMELRRNDAWANVFVTLKDPSTAATLAVTINRQIYDRLQLDLTEGETVHVAGRAELYEQKGELGFRATTIERIGVGDHLLALEQLKRKLAAEGLFAQERKRRLPRVPRAVGILTGADAAARGDLVATIAARFPATKVVIREARVQGKGAADAIVAALVRLAAHPEVDVVVLARGGGSFEDLLPFSDEAVVRAVAAAPVPVVSAVGHEQDTPLCDLAADVRAATPTAAAALVVPDQRELVDALDAARRRLELAVRSRLERDRARLEREHERLRAAPLLLLERRRAALDHAGARLQALSPLATLGRGYAIVRAGGSAIRSAAELRTGDHLDVELAYGAVGARVEELRP
jgi:exodeoxyribonuclease VII large subunit